MREFAVFLSQFTGPVLAAAAGAAGVIAVSALMCLALA